MSSTIRLALAAALALTFASTAMARVKPRTAHALPFTVAEKMVFDRASAKWDAPNGGDVGN